MAFRKQARTPSSGFEQSQRVQDPAVTVTQHALRYFINQSPVGENILMTLPHANYDMTQGQSQAPIDTVDGQLHAGHTPGPALTHAQGSSGQHHTQSTSHGGIDTRRRRKHRRQARQLTGVGEQFPQQTGTTSMPRQGMMHDLHNIDQQSQQAHIGPFFMGHEDVCHQTQECMEGDLCGVGGQFQ